MDGFVQVVAANKDCPTDEGFAFQVRVQLLAQSAVQAREKQEADHAYTQTAVLPASIYLKALQGQLSELKQSLSPSLQKQGILMITIHYVELCINDSAYTANSCMPVAATPVVGRNNFPVFERLECLWQSVGAIKSWLDAFLTVSNFTCLGCSFLLWAQLSRCLVTLYRLTTYADPAWDRHAVRNSLDMALVLDQLADKIEGSDLSNSDLFKQIPLLMRDFRARAFATDTFDCGLAAKVAGWPGSVSHSGSGMISQDELMMQTIDWENDMVCSPQVQSSFRDSLLQ